MSSSGDEARSNACPLATGLQGILPEWPSGAGPSNIRIRGREAFVGSVLRMNGTLPPLEGIELPLLLKHHLVELGHLPLQVHEHQFEVGQTLSQGLWIV